MSQAEATHGVRPMLEVPLAKPWHYRRSGVYYLRVRRLGTKDTITISLRSTNRTIAMTNSKQLQTTLRAFHLDNPNATWDELRAHIRSIAEEILDTPTEWEMLDGMGLVYSDLKDDLRRIAATASLRVPHAKAVVLGRHVMAAAEERLQGDPRALVGIIEKLDTEDLEAQSKVAERVPKVVSEQHTGITFEALSGLYMAEQKPNVKESTMAEVKSSCSTLAAILGPLDLKKHTRADLVGVKEKLLEDRKASTVNKLLARLSTVLQWGVNNGYIERAYDKKLKITKGAESSRQAFTQEQVKALMDYANSLEESSWERWGLSLSVITGARIGEIQQLRKEDIQELEGTWAISLNEDDGKELKNKYSNRYVPLVDGAYGFDLKAFLRYIEGVEAGGSLFTQGYAWFANKLNTVLRQQLNLGESREYSFHSLRHSLASLLKAKGIPVGVAQSILGHSSQSITFDLYGGNQRVGVEKLADALREAFGLGIAE
jgi:integrase